MVRIVPYLAVGLGILCGFVLAWPVNLALGFVVGVIGGWLLWVTRDAEIGALYGISAAFLAGLFVIPLGLATLLFNVALSPIDFSWLLRIAP